ncbi:Ribosomal RNA small subunit methyltransferase H [Clostridium bornimense]|uniref:Ribosomal RNA small subunit methyltransferase H n=1 Tax=Clostridium bornimense TaxID=1216932 RepID=W6RWM2_9CLOT|nr:16S rRNA (cytosine(1402)-N(4))-methyltransferase RsmH [Clostridium bornimense]CDM68768.1 Ribosomal RNA small subunit methyltransferase H [Clostridium bornimense]
MEFSHYTVMLSETVDGLNVRENGIYVDCTLGGGGHSEEILKRLDGSGKLIGIDQDTMALEASKKRLSKFNNVEYVHNNFYNISEVLDSLGIEKVDGIVMDLGVSSPQLDQAERGFSYHKDAPLDMRMNREKEFSAYNVVNEYSEEKLYKVIRDFGEEKFAKNIAKHIVIDREIKPIETTFELVEIIKKSIPAKFRKDGHPGKKTFQAIRIEVNSELSILDKAINDSIDRLNDGGRLSIITFHSLEDRIVKNIFRDNEKPCTCPSEFPICVCGKKPKVKIITRKPIECSDEELNLNNRSRSAKLRICEKKSSK